MCSGEFRTLLVLCACRAAATLVKFSQMPLCSRIYISLMGDRIGFDLTDDYPQLKHCQYWRRLLLLLGWHGEGSLHTYLIHLGSSYKNSRLAEALCHVVQLTWLWQWPGHIKWPTIHMHCVVSVGCCTEQLGKTRLVNHLWWRKALAKPCEGCWGHFT